MLIVLLGMLLVPSLGWRWMIRISIAPSLILIFLFKVGVSVLVLRLSRPDPSLWSKPVYSRIGSLQRVCWKRSCCRGDAAEDRSHEPVFTPSWPPGGAASGGFLLRFPLRFLLRFLRAGGTVVVLVSGAAKVLVCPSAVSRGRGGTGGSC